MTEFPPVLSDFVYFAGVALLSLYSRTAGPGFDKAPKKFPAASIRSQQGAFRSGRSRISEKGTACFTSL